jgi:Protein of unknown function (DUF2934)
MSKKRNIASEPTVSGGASPVRTRKHAPAKRITGPVVEGSSSIETNTSAATLEESTSNSAVTDTPAFEDIARLAYSYWEARGYQGGSPDEDWLRAEQELAGGLRA